MESPTLRQKRTIEETMKFAQFKIHPLIPTTGKRDFTRFVDACGSDSVCHLDGRLGRERQISTARDYAAGIPRDFVAFEIRQGSYRQSALAYAHLIRL